MNFPGVEIDVAVAPGIGGGMLLTVLEACTPFALVVALVDEVVMGVKSELTFMTSSGFAGATCAQTPGRNGLDRVALNRTRLSRKVYESRRFAAAGGAMLELTTASPLGDRISTAPRVRVRRPILAVSRASVRPLTA
jgi:hypothetical protein